MPAEGRGLAVACPGGGIVAGVEVATGAIRWLARYDQAATRRAGWRSYRPDGWRPQSPLVVEGVAYVTPPDSDFIYALEVETGEVLWRRERGDHRYLAGVHEGKVCVVGADATCFGPRGDVEWRVALPSAAVGRPTIAGRALHVPLAGGILYLDAATGSELAWAAWDEWAAARANEIIGPMVSGDLLVAGDKLFVATAYTLNVFGPLERRDSIARQLAADPDDPLAHYARGQECHWEGDAAGAAASLEKVLELAARKPGAVDEQVLADVRRRLAACQADLSRRHERAGRLDLALAACRAALRYVPKGGERQTLLLRLAALARGLRQWPDAVAAYQEVLALTEPGDGDWATARSELEGMLRQAGRGAYEPFERLAAASLERGGEADLVAIVKRYPTSLASVRALTQLADAAARGGRAAEARLWLLQLVSDYPDAPEAPDALRRLALGYAQEGAVAMARGAIERLRVRSPKTDCGIPDSRLQIPDSPGNLAPPFRIAWEVRPGYGAIPPLVPPAAAEPAGGTFITVGRAFECRSTEDGARRWADRPGWIGIRIMDAERRGGGVRIMSTVTGVEVPPAEEPPPPRKGGPEPVDPYKGAPAPLVEPRQPVFEATPAERAGLRGGDVLVSFEGKPLRDAQDLIATCTERRAGDPIRIGFLRGEELRTVEVRLGARPSLAEDPQLPTVAFVGVVGEHALVRKTTRLDAVSVARGEVAWSFPISRPEAPADAAGDSLAAAGPGIVAAADTTGRIVALDPATGRLLWSRHLDEPTVHRITLWPFGLVVASSRPATVRLLNAFDGHVLFESAEPQAAGAPCVALDARGRLCYAMGCVLGCWDAARGDLAWSVRVANFTAQRLWVAGAAVVAQGVDNQGVEAIESRQLASGQPAWSLALARGERIVLAELAPDAFYLASRQGARTTLRRLDASTGQVAWAQTLPRHEELAAWADAGPAIALGLTVLDNEGLRRAEVKALDRLTGETRHRLPLGPGAMAGLTRVGSALFAVVEAEPGAGRVPAWLGDEILVQPAKYRIVRITRSP